MLRKSLLVSSILFLNTAFADTQVRSWCEPNANNNLYKVHVSISRMATPGTDYVTVSLFPEGENMISNHYKIPNGTYNYNFSFLDVRSDTYIHIINEEGNINKGPNNGSGPGTCGG